MDRAEAKERARKIVTAAIKLTRHDGLEVGDIMFALESEKALKIISLDGPVASVSDKEKEFIILRSDLAHTEAVRLCYLESR